MRSSVYIEGQAGEKVLIDAGPEFRLQAIKAGINGLDAVLLTHAHADHIHGLDDVRPFTCVKPIPVYGNEETISEMKERFSYIFRPTQEGGGKPRLLPNVAKEPIKIGTLTITPVPVKHGALDILGWEITEASSKKSTEEKHSQFDKSFLYLTDVNQIPSATMAQLNNHKAAMTRIVIIGSLRTQAHKTHFTFDEALNTAITLNPKAIYLTHMCHSHSHKEIEGICLTFREKLHDKVSVEKMGHLNIQPAHDGLELTL